MLKPARRRRSAASTLPGDDRDTIIEVITTTSMKNVNQIASVGQSKSRKARNAFIKKDSLPAGCTALLG